MLTASFSNKSNYCVLLATLRHLLASVSNDNNLVFKKLSYCSHTVKVTLRHLLASVSNDNNLVFKKLSYCSHTVKVTLRHLLASVSNDNNLVFKKLSYCSHTAKVELLLAFPTIFVLFIIQFIFCITFY